MIICQKCLVEKYDKVLINHGSFTELCKECGFTKSCYTVEDEELTCKDELNTSPGPITAIEKPDAAILQHRIELFLMKIETAVGALEAGRKHRGIELLKGALAWDREVYQESD